MIKFKELKRNPMVWILCIMMVYFTIAAFEWELKIPAYFAQKAHEKKMEKDPGYAADVVRIRQQNNLMRATALTTPKEQVEEMFAARASGVPIEKGCTYGIMTYGHKSDATRASCTYSVWSLGEGGSHVDTILEKIEREGMPPAGVLKRWKMLADGCIPGDDSTWCKKFAKAMACSNNCMGSQYISSARENY